LSQNQFDTDVWTLLSERYKDFVRIGEGGTAVVYKAHDETLNKTVAIKTMSISRMTPEMVLKFQHEARAASKLQHPNLITVFDFGLIGENSRPYLVMDYVEGKSLEDYLQEVDFLTVDQTITILLEVLRGMEFAHQNGVVHRDLKPSNILLLAAPEPDARLKVVDFGIAKLQDEGKDLLGGSKGVEGFTTDGQTRARLERTGGRSSRGRTGELIGSPFYISPEQIKGASVDQRTDVYSIGCIMFRMLSGMVPFEGETHLETYSQHLNELPPKIVDPVVPDALHELMDKCLAKDPAERPDSMKSVADELRNIQRKLAATETASGGSRDKKQLAVKRTLAVVVAVGLIVIGGAVLTNSMKKPAPRVVHNAKEKIDPLVASMHGRWALVESSEGPTFWQGVSDATDSDVNYVVAAKVPNVSLRNTQVTASGLEKLVAVPLTELDLTGQRFDDSAMQHVAKMTNLEYLNLTNNRVSDAGLKELAPLRNLKRLDLDQDDLITDEGLATIIKQWPDLIYLNLAKTSVTEKGLLRLKELRSLCAIELAELTLSDKVMEYLISWDNMRELNLNHCTFERKWVKEFPKMRGLRTLYVSQIKSVDPKDYLALRKELEDKHITFHCFDHLRNELKEISPIVELIGTPED